MQITQLAFASLLAASAIAAPVESNATLESRDETFNLQIWNNCKFTKEVAIHGVWGGPQNYWKPTNIAPGKSITMQAPFRDVGMRLVGHAEWGLDGQFKVQALFEFGYSTYAGKEGTAYDLSLMHGSDGDIGMGAYPIDNGQGSASCESKTCFPWQCPVDQGWLDPNQPYGADTVCYQGKADFKIVYCP